MGSKTLQLRSSLHASFEESLNRFTKEHHIITQTHKATAAVMSNQPSINGFD